MASTETNATPAVHMKLIFQHRRSSCRIHPEAMTVPISAQRVNTPRGLEPDHSGFRSALARATAANIEHQPRRLERGDRCNRFVNHDSATAARNTPSASAGTEAARFVGTG